jgi:tetratricopeptide (TPR) repeat protein
LFIARSADEPDWSPPHQLLAEIHYSAGEWDKAASQLEWLADHGVDNSRTALIAAGLQLARRDLKSALENLQFARRLEPALAGVNTLLGIVLMRLGRWDEAEDAFHEATEQNPNDARARDGLAAVSLQHGEYEEAADWALRALEQDMRLFHAHYHLGVALAHLDRPAEAVGALETAARIDEKRAAPYFWLARIVDDEASESPRAAAYRQQGRDVIRRRRARVER